MKLLPDACERLRRDAGLSRFAAVALLIAVWLVPGSLASLETYAMAQLAGRGLPFWRAIAAQAPAWLAYGVFTPLILHLAGRYPLHVAPRTPKLLAHGALALVLGWPYALTATAAYSTFMPMRVPLPFAQMALSWYLSALPVMVLTYFAVVGGGSAIHWFVRHRDVELKTARLQAQLSDARLGALRMQLRPHFLFNSLNAVAVLVRDRDNQTAERVLELLSDLLRTTLRDGAEHRVPLEEELAFIRRYLEIEEIRFSDRLCIHFEIEPGLERAIVPALVFQPLVENAIRHGIGRSSSAGRIEIAARRRGERLVLEVVDDGPGPHASLPSLVMSPGPNERSGQPRHGGVGLANTRSRLEALYDDASCELVAAPGGGTIARIDMPLECPQHASEGVAAHA